VRQRSGLVRLGSSPNGCSPTPKPRSKMPTGSIPPGGRCTRRSWSPGYRSQVARAHQVEPNPMLCVQDPHPRRHMHRRDHRGGDPCGPKGPGARGHRAGYLCQDQARQLWIPTTPARLGPRPSTDSAPATCRANIPAGKYASTHVGRVAVRSPGEIQHLHQHRECPRCRPPSLHRRLAIRKLGWSHQPEGVINAS